MFHSTILGIDISKDTFDVALCKDGQIIATSQFTNNQPGFKKLDSWLVKQGANIVWACLEATGRYGDQLALILHNKGHQVSVVNPAQIKRYAESKLRRNKSDKLDAVLISDFCATQKPNLWTPPPLEIRQLQEAVRRLNALIVERTREQNRQQSGFESEIVLASIEAHLNFLNSQIGALHNEIQAHIDRYPPLKEDLDLLTSIKGIGPTTAARILGELPHITSFKSADQVVAYAGLSVQHRDSGSSVRKKPKLSKIGNAHLRTALYFPAISAIRYNPIIKAQAERLRAKGKLPMEIIGAAMRKLLRLVYGVLKSRQYFDPDYIVNQQNAA